MGISRVAPGDAAQCAGAECRAVCRAHRWSASRRCRAAAPPRTPSPRQSTRLCRAGSAAHPAP